MRSITFLVFTRPVSFEPYSEAQKSFKINHSLILKGMFRFKPVSQFAEEYHSIVSCQLNMKNLLLNSFYNSLCNKEIANVF
jgi:hypothetical protein